MMMYDSHDEWVYIAEGPGNALRLQKRSDRPQGWGPSKAYLDHPM